MFLLQDNKIDKRKGQRSERGTLAQINLLWLAFGILWMGIATHDISHVTAVRGQLQRALDAAALSGAYSILEGSSNAEYHARQMAAMNMVEGNPLSESTSGTTVNVIQIPASTAGEMDSLEVNAQISVNTLLGLGFASTGAVIAATSTAGSSGTIATMPNQEGKLGPFPLAVAIDIPGSSYTNPSPLNNAYLGDSVTFNMWPLADANAYATPFFGSTTNDPLIRSMMEQRLGTTTYNSSDWATLNLGDTIGLNDGSKVLQTSFQGGNDITTTLSEPDLVLFLPVILGRPEFEEGTGSGSTSSSAMVGFVALYVSAVNTTVDEDSGDEMISSISGTIVKAGIGKQRQSIPTTGYTSVDEALKRLNPGAVDLVYGGGL